MVKVCLTGECKSVHPRPDNGNLSRCAVRVELDHSLEIIRPRYDVELFVPAEFATLFEVGRPITITLEQNGS